MHKFTKRAAAVVFGVALSSLALAQGTFVTVNGKAVPQSFADAVIAEQMARGAKDTPEFRNAVREDLIRRELLLQEARKAGVEKRPEVAAQIEAARQGLTIRAFAADFAKKNTMTDKQLMERYETIKGQLGTTEYKARHILVKEEADAKAIIENLKRGAKFEELAKQSIDPGTKDNGGELGWASPATFFKPFGEALSTLSKGKYTEAPVKTDAGYHVILLDDSRPLKMPAFEEVKQRLLEQAQAELFAKYVEELRSKAKVQ